MEQLLQVVLQGSPRQQQLIINLVAVQDPKELRGGEGPSGAGAAGPARAVRDEVSAAYLGLVVLQPVGLVHHQAGPLDGAQDGLVDGDELVGGEQNVEFDLHFFLEGRGSSTWEQSWEAGGSRSPEKEVRRRSPETPGSPGTERKTLATRQRDLRGPER